MIGDLDPWNSTLDVILPTHGAAVRPSYTSIQKGADQQQAILIVVTSEGTKRSQCVAPSSISV